MATTEVSIQIDLDDMEPYALRYGWTPTVSDGKGIIENPISYKEAFFKAIARNIADEATQRRAYDAGRVASEAVIESAKARIVSDAIEIEK